MPFPISNHCFERVSLDLAIIVGGSHDAEEQEVSDQTLLYNLTSEQWTLGTMIQSEPRSHHACGTVQVQGAKQRILMVAGGRTPAYSSGIATIHSRTTELLFIPENGLGGVEDTSFAKGPDIPVEDDIHTTAIAISFDRHTLYLAAVLSEATVIFGLDASQLKWLYHPELSFKTQPRIQDHHDFFAFIIPKVNDSDCHDDADDNQNVTLPRTLVERRHGLLWRQVGNDGDTLFYFHKSRDRQTWETALAFCLRHNASLPEIKTVEENTRLAIKSRALGLGSLWLGVINDLVIKEYKLTIACSTKNEQCKLHLHFLKVYLSVVWKRSKQLVSIYGLLARMPDSGLLRYKNRLLEAKV